MHKGAVEHNANNIPQYMNIHNRVHRMYRMYRIIYISIYRMYNVHTHAKVLRYVLSLIPSCAHPVVYTVGPEFPWLRLIIYIYYSII